MLRTPPEILITTPESLNILLTSAGGRALLGDLETVILDEVHAVVGGKRGIHLISAVERLVPLSGEFQRIALSATVRPLDAHRPLGRRSPASSRAHRSPDYTTPRPVTDHRRPSPSATTSRCASPWRNRCDGSDALWAELARRAQTDHRRQPLHPDLRQQPAHGGEGGAYDQRATRPAAGLLPPRRPVPRDPRGGRGAPQGRELEAIVATNSLELGIDIGAIDEVALVQAPPSMASDGAAPGPLRPRRRRDQPRPPLPAPRPRPARVPRWSPGPRSTVRSSRHGRSAAPSTCSPR